MSLNGLANVNVELTNRCNKKCWMCGRRRVECEYPDLTLLYGDMDFGLVERISRQLPSDIVVQLHNNGEALLYPRFGEAVRLFNRQLANLVTNGKLLLEKYDEIVNHLDTLAVSVFENDDEAEEQYEIVGQFLERKGDRKPFTLFRLNGNVDGTRYEKLGLVTRRILHSPLGSYNYQKADPTIPEVGICLDLLGHLAINKDGRASICVRFDPKGLGVIGDCTEQTLGEIWNSPRRREWLQAHMRGRRNQVPLCSYCHFWGVPTGFDCGEQRKSQVADPVFFKQP